MQQPTTFIICLAVEMGAPITLQLLSSLGTHGWSSQIHPAQNGWQLTAARWQERGVRLVSNSKLAQQPGAQGCLWSHMDLWELCLARSEPIAVLESDALCQRPWPTNFTMTHDLAKIAYKFDQLRPNKRTGLWSPGAVGYVITPRGAATLLDYVRTTSALEADKLIGTGILSWTHAERLFDINTSSYTRSSTRSINLSDYEQKIWNK